MIIHSNLALSTATALPAGEAAYNTQMIWEKVVFQTSSSNSCIRCIRSTTSIQWGSNPNGPSFSAKAFLDNL
jgi:hypothetical protein